MLLKEKNNKKEYNLRGQKFIKLLILMNLHRQIKPNCICLYKKIKVFGIEYIKNIIIWRLVVKDIAEESDSDEETESMTYQKLDMVHMIPKVTKTLQSELMNKDLKVNF